MKNVKILKEYYHSLSGTGKAVFVLSVVVVLYVALEMVS